MRPAASVTISSARPAAPIAASLRAI
jgi:hypothetical protein